MEHAVTSYQELSFSNFGSADQSNAPGGTINNSSGPGNHFPGSIFNGPVYLGPEGGSPRQLNQPVDNEGEAFVNGSHPHKRRRDGSESRHYLAEMPSLCCHYQHQPIIRDALQHFISVDDTVQTRHKVFHGLPGSGKTQACVKFMNDVQIEQFGRWSRLLWLKAESPRALFGSLQAMHENFEMRRRQAMDSLDMGQKAEITAVDVSNWLSGQEQPWLMILDHLSFHNAKEVGDGLGPESMKRMLRDLFKATNGRIIITSRHSLNQCLSSQEEPSSVRHMNQETAFQLVKAYFPKKSLGPSELRATRELCKLVDHLPLAISLACNTIKSEKISVDSYVQQWQDVFKKEPHVNFISDSHTQSLNVTLKLCYDGLKNRAPPDGQLRPTDLLKMLACLNGTHVSEAIFSRAWQGSLDEDKCTRNTQGFDSSWMPGWLEFLKQVFRGSPSQSEVLETHQIGLKFPARRPGEEQWQGSVAQRCLRQALSVLEDVSFLEFTDDPAECNIKVSPFVQAWIRWHHVAQDSLDLRQSWRQAAWHLTRSMSKVNWVESRDSTVFWNFQQQAALHIQQLQRVSDSLDLSRGTESTSWVQDVLSLPGAIETTYLFADALNLHGFPALALQMWEAYTSLVKPTRHSVDELIQYLVHAETLEQCGKHQQSLEVRELCRESLQKLQIQDPATGGIIAQDSTRLRVLRLMVQRDIADSHWKLGSKGKSSRLLKAVLCELEQVQIPSEERGNNYLRTLMIETQLARVRCLVRHEHDHEEASALIMRVLVYTRECVEEMPRTQRLHLQALSLEAEIMSARGQYLEARDGTRDVLEKWQQLDPDVRRLETMIAMMAYANSLSRLGRHEESLQLRKKIEQQLCRDDCTVPQSDEFFVDSRQNLAKCYMASAEMLYDRERRKYEPKGLVRTALAIKTIQHVLEVRQANKIWGHAHTDTLATLALLIKYERKAKSLGSDYGIERWTADTALDASRLLFEDAEHVTDAWLKVLVEDCLVGDPEKRLARLEMLRKTRPEIERPEHRKVEVLIRREIATAHMKVLYQYKSREKRQRKTDPRFKTAAKALEAVWKEHIELLGPEDADTLTSLRCAIEAYSALKDYRYLDLQANLLGSIRRNYGEESPQAIEELMRLKRGRKEQESMTVEDRK
ncbi:tetratricopeptide-like helical [Fusarium pseudocircinatum]|uniref:Tetratricopeptide-like helical n=1 Tax=Fusarium pseudocircinatum TaxID=56676 RepID=A0A8H5KJA5_9HYPO|nr:tetratricopeptide-like helical [Fusarium pseudocircinatum]